MPAPASDQDSETHEADHHASALRQMRLYKAPEALVAEPPAGPNTPAQPDDLLPALGTKVWSIIREKRQVVRSFLPAARIIGDPGRKQPIPAQLRPKSARLKNSERAGILC